MGMAGTAMERHVIGQCSELFGWDRHLADGFLTSGGTLGNLTALLAARATKSSACDWEEGSHRQLAVMVSDQAHYCIDRAARIMGWGDTGIIRVPTDGQFRMQTEKLKALYDEAISDGIDVIAVVGSACSTSTGSFDDLKAIGRFCKDQHLWFHVDGAHGCAVAFSDLHRELIEGIETADSVVIDFHKIVSRSLTVHRLAVSPWARQFSHVCDAS